MQGEEAGVGSNAYPTPRIIDVLSMCSCVSYFYNVEVSSYSLWWLVWWTGVHYILLLVGHVCGGIGRNLVCVPSPVSFYLLLA